MKKTKINGSRIFLVCGSNVQEYFEIGEFLIPVHSEVITYSDAKFDKKCSTIKEARYCAMLYELKKGKPLENYKKSKYYKYYCEQLKKEHPEYLI